MQSPFKILRRYQKAFLITMAVVAMISFGVGDIISRMTRSGGAARGDVVVETNVENLTNDALRRLMQRRYLANAFMFKALLAANPEYEKFAQFMPQLAHTFGGQSPHEVVNAWLMQHEARRLGIVVDDKQIEDFIRQSTNRKLSTGKFTEVLDVMQVKALEIYDILRDELAAQTAFRLLAPVSANSPEQYWKFYRLLHTRQKIEVAPLPIKDFTADIEAPTDAALDKFFHAHKSQFESSADGEYRPGFRQPPKVDLHYLQFTYLGVEEQVLKGNPLSDAEIEAYYEARKAIDRRFHDVELSTPADDESATDETAPIDPVVTPEGEPRPEAPARPADDASGEPGNESSCGSEGNESEVIGSEDKPAEAEPATASESAAPAAAETESSGDAAASAREEEPEQPQAGDSAPAADVDKPSRKAPVRSIKFKPLNDDLREMIRESIVHERTVARMKEVSSEAADALRDVGLKFAQQSEFDFTRGRPEDLARLADRSREEMQAIAGKLGAKFGDTGLVGARELSELPGIGKTQEPEANEFVAGGVRTVVDLAFDSETLCRVMESESAASSGGSRDVYVFWKVQHVPAHVPALNEPGVRDQVLAAWKLQQSLPVARKRAEQLAELTRTSKESMTSVLAGQTVTGGAKSLALTVQESPEFSWWRESSAPDASMRQPPLRLSDPIVVTGAGMKFMEFAFDDLDEGEVGVVYNDDASVCYVVKVLSRRPADREAFKSAPLFSSMSPYGRLAQLEQQAASSEFVQQLEKAYAVRWHDAESGPAAPVESFE